MKEKQDIASVISPFIHNADFGSGVVYYVRIISDDTIRIERREEHVLHKVNSSWLASRKAAQERRK